MKLCFCSCGCARGTSKGQNSCYPCNNGVHEARRPIDLSVWEKAFAESEVLGRRSYDDNLC